MLLRRSFFLLMALITPFAAISVGAYVGYLNGASPLAFLWNVVSAVSGIFICLKLPAFIHKSSLKTVQLITLALLGIIALSLLAPGLEGVKRYLPIGRLIVNPSSLFSPLLLFCLFRLLRENAVGALTLNFAISLIHFLQPDAGQATAFGGAALVLFIFYPATVPVRLSGAFIAALGIYLTWRQPDFLPAVPHVEQILHLIAHQGLIPIFCAGIILGLLLLPPLRCLRAQNRNLLHFSLIAYLSLAFIVTEFGNFPVPLFGAGASPVLGYYFLISLCIESKLSMTKKKSHE